MNRRFTGPLALMIASVLVGCAAISPEPTLTPTATPAPTATPTPTPDPLELGQQALDALDAGDTEQALDLLDQALEIDDQNLELFYNRGLIHYQEGNYEQAFEDLTDALELNPENPIPFFWRARTFDALGNTDDAIDDYRAFLRLYDFNDELSQFARQRSLGLFLDEIDVQPPEPSVTG